MKTLIIIATGLLAVSSGLATTFGTLKACNDAAKAANSNIACPCSKTKIVEGLGVFCVEWTGAIAVPGPGQYSPSPLTASLPGEVIWGPSALTQIRGLRPTR